MIKNSLNDQLTKSNVSVTEFYISFYERKNHRGVFFSIILEEDNKNVHCHMHGFNKKIVPLYLKLFKNLWYV